MKKFRILMGAMVLAMVAATVIACTKDKTTQQESLAQQNVANPNDLTLAEMIEALSWEEGKAFFENQPIKDYTYACESVLNDCDGAAKSEEDASFVISWRWPSQDGGCNSVYAGICKVIKKEKDSAQKNAMGYFEQGKLVIVPTSEENGFTADGYLAIGMPIESQNDSIIIREGIYSVYFDEEQGRYSAVAVDFVVRP